VRVIMVGGRGQRSWLRSTADRSKQFLDLERRGRTLL
jgi:mannose-1-phosphate guanylyltransferase